jgi:hypothetical protein
VATVHSALAAQPSVKLTVRAPALIVSPRLSSHSGKLAVTATVRETGTLGARFPLQLTL